MPVTATGDAGLRVAIAGAGLMGRWHAHAARRAGARLVAVIDPDPARSAGIAAKATKVLTRADDLDAVDVLHICTPTGTHGALIELAAQRGWHVLAEKPLAESEQETTRLMTLADGAGTLLCPVHQYAFERSVETILRDLDRVGRPHMVELAFFSAGAAGRDVTSLAGFAADILPHPVSILQRLLGRPLPGPGDWAASRSAPATYQMSCTAGEVAVRITISLAARPTRASLAVIGDQGSFEADLFHDYAVFRDGRASRRGKIVRPFADASAHLGHASFNLLGRALRRETAYPGLATLCRRFYGAVQGLVAIPITREQVAEGARLRDHFLAMNGPEHSPR